MQHSIQVLANLGSKDLDCILGLADMAVGMVLGMALVGMPVHHIEN
jgi:hypothetical protein